MLLIMAAENLTSILALRALEKGSLLPSPSMSWLFFLPDIKPLAAIKVLPMILIFSILLLNGLSYITCIRQESHTKGRQSKVYLVKLGDNFMKNI